MEGDKCIKAWDEAVFGTVGAKFYDFGLNYMAFYNDGTCRLGYTSSVYSNCEELLKDIENHPIGLYDTWQWSCNFEIQGAEARAEFEKEYFNEEDYPCCAQ